ncbi:MAG: ATP-binding protein [Candidatus Onthovivens sp.]|nr:ATP-binding protein [Candidatus Onthovivens sp.]
MKKKIFSVIISLVVGVIILISGVVTFSFSSIYEKNSIKELQNEAALIIKGYEESDLEYLNSLSDINLRVNLINFDGEVIFDNKTDAETLENHSSREEFVEALNSGYGESKRESTSLLKTYYYVAYKVENRIILRVAKEVDSIFYILLNNLWPLYLTALICIIVSIVLAIVLSKKLVTPINNIDLENPLANNKYKEIEPLLVKIETQKNELIHENDEVIKASKIRQEFTSNVSHELKTPLHIISGYAELIKEGIATADDSKEFATKIYKEADRMSKLVEDIMKISKLEDSSDVNKTDLCLKEIIIKVVDSLSIEAKKNKVKFETNLEDLHLYADYESIYSIIFNLVDNAIKYNKKNGKVFINLYCKDNKIFIQVKDTGIGIPSTDLERIFERFYRIDKSRSKELGGTGLGLAIVKHSVILNKGTIKVESDEKNGTIFTVIF